MLKKTGLSLLVSLGVLSAAGLTSLDKNVEVVGATLTEVSGDKEGSPRASTGPKPKARNSKRGRGVAGVAVADAEKTDSDSEGSASEKDTKQGPRPRPLCLQLNYLKRSYRKLSW